MEGHLLQKGKINHKILYLIVEMRNLIANFYFFLKVSLEKFFKHCNPETTDLWTSSIHI